MKLLAKIGLRNDVQMELNCALGLVPGEGG